MKIIVGAVQCGKTTRAVHIFRKLLEQDPTALFVTYSSALARQVSEFWGLPKESVVSVHALRYRAGMAADAPVVVDDADHVLLNLLGDVRAMTINVRRDTEVLSAPGAIP